MNILAVTLLNKTLSLMSHASMTVIIDAVRSTTTSIMSITDTMKKTDMIDYNKMLIETDIGFVVSVLDSVVGDYLNKDCNQTIKIALISLHDILVEIHQDLVVINDAINNHRQKYFNSMRTFKCTCTVDKMKQNNGILVNRYKMLFDLLRLYSNTRQ